MLNVAKRFKSLFSSEVFTALQNAEVVDIAHLNAIIALLVKLNLPFTMNFNQATNTTVAVAQLTINLTPTTTITLILPFARGPIIIPQV